MKGDMKKKERTRELTVVEDKEKEDINVQAYAFIQRKESFKHYQEMICNEKMANLLILFHNWFNAATLGTKKQVTFHSH